MHPVQTGWLLLWGKYEEDGRRKIVAGNRVYPTLCDARRRLADSVLELTRQPRLAAQALDHFDQMPFQAHRAGKLPESL